MSVRFSTLRHTAAIVAAVVLSLGCSMSASAVALLTGSVNTTPPTSTNLTTAGTLDWAVWGGASSTGSPEKLVLNEKSGGVNAFSSISAVTLGNNVRGGNASTELFSYTDGVSPTSLTDTPIGLIFTSALDSQGSGVQFTVIGDPMVERQVQIWASGTNGQGFFTASLNGAVPVELESQTYGTTKTPTLFTINFRPNVVGDVLTVNFVLSSDGAGGSSHVGFTAATLAPEPGVAGLLMLGVSLAGLRRRR